ncbi:MULTISPECIES: IS1182 family transposase [Mycobacterium]|uniref:IS1182 family transposase n=1 Tax=Mycobacterium TaxID=1763 RepID=UPI00200E8BE3|nr:MULTISPECIES: IS1182 family transposase [Mycobacterium]UQB93162.1 IS1182 family transposase [Mycobacterium intracellulare]WSE44264.1 IS1182 family transposase [Mycobacterium sp. 3-98]WSE46122.1 IS1182 family transposase [Mycobacterium sp. 3-98]WSE47249.1 IS1182 family transposase [Mycobacterium sp. 3-98]
MQGRSDDQRELLDAESVAGHLLKGGSVFGFLAAHRRQLFPEELFADLFPSRRGRPSVPAEVMASVITLQALHGLSDNETVDAVTFDLRWKAACGLPVTAAAFHSTTLTYWRRRLAESDRPNRIFEVVKAVVAQSGALSGKTRRALDSTVLDDAVATQDTVTQLIGAIRRVGREVPSATEVIAAHCLAHDYSDPGKPAIIWDDAAAREALVDALVADARRLLTQLSGQPLEPRAADAVALLALIAGQDVEPAEGSDGTDGQWRIAQSVAPDRVVSTVDPESRHVHKSPHRQQDGFKAHVVVEPDTGIITGCALTKAAGVGNHEVAVGLALLANESGPMTVLADAAYGSGEFRAQLAQRGHTDRVKPPLARRALAGGFTVDDFTVDHDARTATCPNGLTRPISRSGRAFFGKACTDCPLRARCTRSRAGKNLLVGRYDAALRAARQAARDPDWLSEYHQHRPMVERSIAWLTRGNRRLRYRGTIKNDHWLHHRVAAINLRRLITLGLNHTGTNWAIA